MREGAVRTALGRGIRLASSSSSSSRTPTPLPSSPSSSSSAPPSHRARASSGCPHHPPVSPAQTHNRCVFTRTSSSTHSHAVTSLPSDVTEASLKESEVRNVSGEVRPFKDMPGPKGLPVLGTLLEYRSEKNRLMMYEVQRQRHREFGTLFKEQFGPAHNLCVADPEVVEQLLRSEGKYPDRPPYQSWELYNKLRNRRGGVMTAQGEYWRASRRAINPKLLKPQAAEDYMPDLNAATEQFVTRLAQLKAQQADNMSIRELPLEMNKFTMEAVGRVLLNVSLGTLDPDASPRVKDFIEAIATMFLTGHQLLAFANLQRLLGAKAWKLHEQAWDTIYDLTYELISSRVEDAQARLAASADHKPQTLDLISHMVSMGTLDREEIVANIIETFMGGVETVANGVSFMLYLLACNQSAQSKLRQEVDSVLGQRACTVRDLQLMPYVKAVVKETMRMFPPIPINARVTQEETVVKNYRIPKGTIVMMNVYTMQRDGAIFPDPDSFDPDRWLKVKDASWNPFSLLPFGYGVRSCVGRRVAENVMYTAAIQVIQQFRLSKDPSFDIAPVARTQLTPGPELPVFFHERQPLDQAAKMPEHLQQHAVAQRL